MKSSNTSERLKQIMIERNMKQVDILNRMLPYCEKFGIKISKSHISQWVSGINEPNQKSLTVLGMALDVDEVWLMGYDVPMKPEVTGAEIAKLAKDGNLWAIAYQASFLDEQQKQVVLEVIKQMVKDKEK